MIYKSSAVGSRRFTFPAPDVGVISSWTPRVALGAGSTRGFDGFPRTSRVWQGIRVRCRQVGLFELL